MESMSFETMARTPAVRLPPSPRATVRLSQAPQARSRARLAPDESRSSIRVPGEERVAVARFAIGLMAVIAAAWVVFVG